MCVCVCACAHPPGGGGGDTPSYYSQCSEAVSIATDELSTPNTRRVAGCGGMYWV